MLTITWNGENQLGSGNSTQHGLSELGRAAIPRLEQAGILLDVSHLNDPGFTQMLDVASRPFVASHSNARSVCGHPRNLADWQIREMISRPVSDRAELLHRLSAGGWKAGAGGPAAAHRPLFGAGRRGLAGPWL